MSARSDLMKQFRLQQIIHLTEYRPTFFSQSDICTRRIESRACFSVLCCRCRSFPVLVLVLDLEARSEKSSVDCSLWSGSFPLTRGAGSQTSSLGIIHNMIHHTSYIVDGRWQMAEKREANQFLNYEYDYHMK